MHRTINMIQGVLQYIPCNCCSHMPAAGTQQALRQPAGCQGSDQIWTRVIETVRVQLIATTSEKSGKKSNPVIRSFSYVCMLWQYYWHEDRMHACMSHRH